MLPHGVSSIRIGTCSSLSRIFGRYHFEPGEEMQHDTSPHDVHLGENLTAASGRAVEEFSNLSDRLGLTVA
jgi:hypothetical protein